MNIFCALLIQDPTWDRGLATSWVRPLFALYQYLLYAMIIDRRIWETLIVINTYWLLSCLNKELKKELFDFLSGVGMASICAVWMIVLYFNIIMAWCLYYLAASMLTVIPWSTCNNTWNTEFCVVEGKKNHQDCQLLYKEISKIICRAC